MGRAIEKNNAVTIAVSETAFQQAVIDLARLAQWRVFHVYDSPELHPLELLWRFMKYQWLPCSAYRSFPCLVQAVEDILIRFGTDYVITFQALSVEKNLCPYT